MREGFQARLSGAMLKAMQSNGINPNGAEMNAITAQMEPFFVSEMESTVGDPKELSKIQDEMKAKSGVAVAMKATEKSVLAAPSVTKPMILTVFPVGGQVGTSVTIKGSGFGANAGRVELVGKLMQHSVWADTVIVATVPKESSTGDLVVTVNGVASNGVPFTVLP
jgi:hypothetical protein